ncbi:MAG: hypothetical protein AAF628_16560 [Planctomycetota bacterium]
MLGATSVALLAALAQPPALGAIVVDNPTDLPREAIVQVSLPLHRGVDPGSEVIVAGERVPAVPLLRRRDGSIAVVQLHVPVRVAARASRELVVLAAGVGDPPAHPDTASPEAWHLQGELPLHCELEDGWGRVWTAALHPDAELAPTSSRLVRTRRYRGLFRRGAAVFLGVVAHVTAWRGSRRGELTIVLDNRAHPDAVGPVLGPVRFRRFALISTADELRFRPRFATLNVLRAPTPRDGGGFRQDLLGPADALYLGDRTAKAFRFDLVAAHGGASAATRAAARAADAPLLAWPTLAHVRATSEFGAHGGPAPAGPDHSHLRWLAWQRRGDFGPFGGHGDSKRAAAQGSARNGPSGLHDLLRWRSAALRDVAETMVLQQALRPTPGTTPRRPEELAAFRQGLSPKAMRHPHGFTPLDYEHFSVDLLHDWYWLTGDPFARDELRRAGLGLRRVVEAAPFATSRGEGWCLQAAVLIARATDDWALVADLHRRFAEQVRPLLRDPPSAVVLSQPAHPDAFGPAESFDAPWQQAALVHGLHAAWRATGDATLAADALRTARAMAGPGWLEGVGPKSLVSALDPGRYTMPMGFDALSGTALIQVGAFVLASEMTDDQGEADWLMRRAKTIADAQGSVSNRWLQLYLDRRAGDR